MYLGVDGGGSKTAFVLIDKQGRLLASHEELSAYYLEVGIDGLRNNLQDGVTSLLTKAQLSADAVDFAYFGLPSYGEDSEQLDVFNDLPSALLPRDRYACGNDMVCGWAAALGCADGINIVAGTGSIAYGEYKGANVRCGGWGEIFGDEGSAYWIARRGLRAFTHMSDGRLGKGPLYQLLKHKLDLHNDLDICAVVLNQWGAARSKIAQLAIVVDEAAVAGDTVARTIFVDAARQLTLIIDATRKRLGFAADEEVAVSYSGGVFNASEMLIGPLRADLLKHSQRYHLLAPKYETIIGAALYAARLDGFQFSDKDLKTFARLPTAGA